MLINYWKLQLVSQIIGYFYIDLLQKYQIMKNRVWKSLVLDSPASQSSQNKDKKRFIPHKSANNKQIHFPNKSREEKQSKDPQPKQQQEESFCLDFIKREKTPYEELQSPTKLNHFKVIPITSKKSRKNDKQASQFKTPLSLNHQSVTHRLSNIKKQFESFKDLIIAELKRQQQIIEETVVSFMKEVNMFMKIFLDQKEIPTSLEKMSEYLKIDMNSKFNKIMERLEDSEQSVTAFRLVNIQETPSHYGSEASASSTKYRRESVNSEESRQKRRHQKIQKEYQFKKMFSVVDKLKQSIHELSEIRTKSTRNMAKKL